PSRYVCLGTLAERDSRRASAESLADSVNRDGQDRLDVAELGRPEVVEVFQPMREPAPVGDVFNREAHFFKGNRAVAVLAEQVERRPLQRAEEAETGRGRKADPRVVAVPACGRRQQFVSALEQPKIVLRGLAGLLRFGGRRLASVGAISTGRQTVELDLVLRR